MMQYIFDIKKNLGTRLFQLSTEQHLQHVHRDGVRDPGHGPGPAGGLHRREEESHHSSTSGLWRTRSWWVTSWGLYKVLPPQTPIKWKGNRRPEKSLASLDLGLALTHSVCDSLSWSKLSPWEMKTFRCVQGTWSRRQQLWSSTSTSSISITPVIR